MMEQDHKEKVPEQVEDSDLVWVLVPLEWVWVEVGAGVGEEGLVLDEDAVGT
jgi:hypothetical protein